jgi:hypothetical protein
MGTQDSEKTLQIIHEMSNPVEAIVNLLYLIRLDSGNSIDVLKYLTQADAQVNCLIDILQRGPDFLPHNLVQNHSRQRNTIPDDRRESRR